MTGDPGPAAAVVAAARDLARRGLVEGGAGNVSALAGDRVWVSAAGCALEALDEGDVVVVDRAGHVLEAAPGREPSSELALHLACYRAFPEVGGVVHAHPVYASMFAVVRRPIPACIDEVTMLVGGDVPVAAYAPSGTPEVGEAAVAALAGRSAALLANHGLVAVGPAAAAAVVVAVVVERTAHVAWGALALGTPHEVPAEARERFRAAWARASGRRGAAGG